MVSLRPCTSLNLGTVLLGRSWSTGHNADSGSGGCSTHHDLRVTAYGWCQKGDVSGRWCASGRFRFQLPDLVELCNKSCHLAIFAGHPSVSEGMSDSNDLFNLADVHVTMVDIVTNSGDGGNNGTVSGGVIGEWNCCLHPAECLNGGTSTWNHWYRGCDVSWLESLSSLGVGSLGCGKSLSLMQMKVVGVEFCTHS